MVVKFDAKTKFDFIEKTELPALLELYGEPIESYVCGKEGDICKVYKCVNGKRLVLKCNGSNGCDTPATVDCEEDH